MVLLSFKFHMKDMFFYTYCEQWHFNSKFFFLVAAFVVACHKLFGINLREKKWSRELHSEVL